MSCRIERVVIEKNCVILRISGRIQSMHVDMIRDLLGREAGRVMIDLKEVVLVAREAVDLLALSEANGIELINCPSYVREWVDQEQARTGIRPWEKEKETPTDDVENA